MAKKRPMDQIRGVVSMGRESEESMGESIHLSVLVDPTCPRWLAIAVRDALMPERDAVVDVHELVERPVVGGYDVGIVVAGSSEALVAGAIRRFACARQHVICVAETSLDIPETYLPAKVGQYVDEVVASESGPLYERLAHALINCTDKRVSCAANFDFCRAVATARLVSKCAAHNALMGVADFIPGAGMPLITMNQINLGFDIAATYGQGLSARRIPEVAVIIAAGLVYRGAARLLIRWFPALGLVIRAGFAYGGTLVTGRMISTHFMEALPPAYGDQAQDS
ncbi:MAG: hypothetical protein Q4A01_04555 [Coriobacteriales bacterium]|nr:hypothetical protein [Coriobacteriales bacterium]